MTSPAVRGLDTCRPWMLIGCAWLIAACGAKSGLDISPAADAGAIDARVIDAGRGDAGFDTLPCRWMIEGPVEVAREEAEIARVFGAVHPARAEVLVVGTLAAGRGLLGIVTVADPPRLTVAERRVDLESAITAALTTVDGYALLAAATCELLFLQDDGTPNGRLVLAGRDCRALQASPGVAVITYDAGGAHRVVTIDLEPDTIERPFFGSPEPTEDDAIAHVDRERVLYVATSPPAATTVVWRTTATDFSRFELPGAPTAVAVDHLVGGVLVFGDGYGLGRIAFDGPLRLDPIGAALPSAFGHLSTNETEALIPLRDGSIAWLPVTLPREYRSIEGFRGPPIDVTVALRPGDSTGGVAYLHREDGQSVIRFRTLTCNR